MRLISTVLSVVCEKMAFCIISFVLLVMGPSGVPGVVVPDHGGIEAEDHRSLLENDSDQEIAAPPKQQYNVK